MTDVGARKLEVAPEGFDSAWAYRHGSGEALAVHVPHPSASGFSPARQHQRIVAFLTEAARRRERA